MNSRAKGARAERQAAEWLNTLLPVGYEAVRAARIGVDGGEDVMIRDEQGRYANVRVTMWVLLDPRLKCEPHTFQILATGTGPHTSTSSFLGTVLRQGHPYVYHVFGPPSLREA